MLKTNCRLGYLSTSMLDLLRNSRTTQAVSMPMVPWTILLTIITIIFYDPNKIFLPVHIRPTLDPANSQLLKQIQDTC